ncbi:hypothetical protein DL93DRAFT_1035172 [Clavulina sp. PMI_390]|nr:hypothetical protein DL93DRAFT_1035172 [Clavulina sp. PMI_390]
MSLESPSSVAARRLAATTRHIAGSQSSAASAAAGSTSLLSLSAAGASSSGSSKSLSPSAGSTIRNVTIFGAGLMGAGIAEVAIQKGFSVTLCDISEKFLDQGKKNIAKSLTRFAKKAGASVNVDEIVSRLKTTTDSVSAVAEADLVIEAIVENLDVKQKLFASLDVAAKPTCIFVSNTSSLSITEIGSKLPDARRLRFGGLHFFSPVPAMKLVEVIRTEETAAEVFDSLFAFSKQLGKVPVACKDTPGFIVNRLLIPYIREAIAMYERGDASARDIDTAMKLGAGHPMGPLELQDAVGLDIGKAIGDGWLKRAQQGDSRVPKHLLQPSKTLDDLVAQGKLGVKSGEGIYKYSKK